MLKGKSKNSAVLRIFPFIRRVLGKEGKDRVRVSLFFLLTGNRSKESGTTTWEGWIGGGGVNLVTTDGGGYE